MQNEISVLKTNICSYLRASADIVDWNRNKDARFIFNERAERDIIVKPIVRYDMFTNSTIWCPTGELYHDKHLLELRGVLVNKLNFVKMTLTSLRELLDYTAWENRYDSLHEHIESCEQHAIDDWVDKVIDCYSLVNSVSNQERIKAFWHYALARAYGKKSKGHFALVVQGTQGTGKSKTTELLFPNVSSLVSMFDTNQQVYALSGMWIAEDSEGEWRKSMKPNTYKNLVSTGYAKVNIKYEKEPRNLAMRFAIVETTNDSYLVHDLTGNRRLLIVSQENDAPRLPLDEVIELSPKILGGAYKWFKDNPEWSANTNLLYDNHSEYSSYEDLIECVEDIISEFAVGGFLKNEDLKGLRTEALCSHHGVSLKQVNKYLRTMYPAPKTKNGNARRTKTIDGKTYRGFFITE